MRSRDGDRLRRLGGIKVKFQIGDRVREGMHPGTVTDVGTVLIQVKSDEGGLRVVCPWELVKILGSHQSHD
jgi:hypothetical protein